MRVAAKKNRYYNEKGQKKVKILTANRTYVIRDVRHWKTEDYLIQDDTGRLLFYDKKYFVPLSKNRDTILNKLGL